MVVEEKVLKDGLDVIKEIIENQPVSKEIVITVYDIYKFVPLIEIEGDKNYMIVSFKDYARLSVNNNTISEDIKSIPRSIVYNIEKFICDNLHEFEIAKQCKRTNGVIRFIIKKK